jgi:hypothetical protein
MWSFQSLEAHRCATAKSVKVNWTGVMGADDLQLTLQKRKRVATYCSFGVKVLFQGSQTGRFRVREYSRNVASAQAQHWTGQVPFRVQA